MSGRSNRDLFETLVADGRLRVRRSPLFDSSPAFAGRTVARDRWRGMLLGLAIGDALGNTSEGRNPGDRLRTHGTIRDYLPNRHADQRAVGLPSDDTQLCFWAIEQALDDGGFDPERYASILSSRRTFGAGKSVSAFLRHYRDGGGWLLASQPSAGNGALMRAAGILPHHFARGGPALWSDATLFAAVTHNDPTAISSAVAFTAMLAELLVAERPPEPPWWHTAFVAHARALEGDDTALEPRGGAWEGRFCGPLWRFVAEVLPEAERRGLSTREACDGWYSGAFLLETVPSALYILMRHAGDPEEAIVRAVNDTRDNDTIAAIVGAAVGALHGEAALPERWRRGLLGRTGATDDGRIMELLDRAERQLERTGTGRRPSGIGDGSPNSH